MTSRNTEPARPAPRLAAVSAVLDGAEALVAIETGASDAAALAPSPFTSAIAAGWARAVAARATNVHGRALLTFEPESDEAAAAIVTGLTMTGMRAATFTGGDGAASMHVSLAAAVGKRLPWVAHLVCRPFSRHAAPVGAGHDDYHALADTGAFALFAKNVQEAADLSLIAHRLAELALTPGVTAQDAILTSASAESIALPARELVRAFLGDPADTIDSPTPAQELVFGARRRRIPERFDLDLPVAQGGVQGADAWAQGAAAQRPYYFEHVAGLADRAFEEYAALTGRRYARAAAYRTEDAEVVIVAHGSVVSDAELVADHLRTTKKWKVGVVNLTMFRPFPADLVVDALGGRRAVLVLERADQPLAVDGPLTRELRAAMAKAVENGRSRAGAPNAGVPRCRADAVPEFYSACFGLGGRPVAAGDLIAAIAKVRDGSGPRHVYLGIDFVRKGTRLPKLQIWQEQLLERYPAIADIAVAPVVNGLVRTDGAIAFRLDGLAGSRLLGTASALTGALAHSLGLQVKAGPTSGPEPATHPASFHATLARDPVRESGAPARVDVLLLHGPAVPRDVDVAAVIDGGAIVVATETSAQELWQRVPATTQRAISQARIRLHVLDGVPDAAAVDADTRAAIAVARFLGASLRVSGLLDRDRLDAGAMFERLAKRLAERDIRAELAAAVRHGFDAVREVDAAIQQAAGADTASIPRIPDALEASRAPSGVASAGRFWEQVGFLYRTGQDGLADPFVALGAMPAATAAIRDAGERRAEVPEVSAGRCTGCGACWTQCPEAAIPGVVNGVDDVLRAAIAKAADGRPVDRLRQLVRPLGDEVRRQMRATAALGFKDALPGALAKVLDTLGWDAERRAAVEAEFAPVVALIGNVAIVRTEAFFDGPESRERGTGGLLSIAVNPEACNACGVCVAVCPEQAVGMVAQDRSVIDRLRLTWRFWRELPDTDDRWIEAGTGSHDELLPRLLLKKANDGAAVGGAACPGCGEKTALHLVLAAVHALTVPKVRAWVAELDALIASLDDKARALLASDADLGSVSPRASGTVDIALDAAKRDQVARIASMLAELKDVRARYTEGPTGRARAACGIVNAAGCSALWAGTYPYSAYPVPWTQHVGHDAPALGLGIFEGQMRKMAHVFALVRRAKLERAGEYDPATHDAELSALDWRGFTDEELALCPPILAVGDGGVVDRGLDALSGVLASGRPVRVVVLDTDAHSSASGRPSSSAFRGQAGSEARAPEESRKELALLGIAHRNVFVLQSSAAAPSHLIAGVLKSFSRRFPALLVLHTPCPPVHGLAADAAPRAARLAVESRAVPLLAYDPAAGGRLAERLSLQGNPVPEQAWPVWELSYVDEDGTERRMSVPLTVADWAVTEGRFRRHFSPAPADGERELVPFYAWLALPAGDRADKAPFIHAVAEGRRLVKLLVGEEIVRLAEERQDVWSLLRDMAGFAERRLAGEHDAALAKVRAEHEATVADLKARYPRLIARRLAEAILRGGQSVPTVDELIARDTAPAATNGAASQPVATAAATAVLEAPAVPSPAPAAEESRPLVMEAYIDSEQCTACNDCTNLNKRMFAYNAKKQAYIKDARAGTFKQLVTAAEKCPVRIIHPGTPLDPNEKDLDKLIERAKVFN